MKEQIRRLIEWVKPYKGRYILGQIAMLISSGAGLAFPYFLGTLLDSSLMDQEIHQLITAIAMLAGIELVSGLSTYITNINLGFISQHVISDLRDRLYAKLQRLSISYYKNRSSGEIVSNMTNDINLFQQAVSTGITYVIQMLITFVVAVIMLFSLDSILTLVLLVSFPIMILVTKMMSKEVKGLSKNTQEDLSNVTSILNQSLSGINIIKAFRLEDQAKNIFGRQNQSWLKNIKSQIKVKAKTRLVVGYLRSFQLLLILGLGAYRVFLGNISTGTLISFILYSQMLAAPIGLFSEIYVELQRALAAADRIFALLDFKEEIVVPENPVEIDDLVGTVQFQHVGFGYVDEEMILKDINFMIERGKTHAFVGKSGAGKTTIFNLIPRFYDVKAGQVKVSGVDVREMGLETLRDSIAIVPQDTYLFEMSIKENILCGKLDATEQEIIQASKNANAHDFIMELPEGYDTIAGEGGCKLSGGQKQRIAIARAFLKNPKILLLDEATSALDTFSESIVQNAISKLISGRTTLIIAHRLSTIINADVIHIIDNGIVVDSGTHLNLMETSKAYRELYERS
jgi:subfamily B ATP-binding cassette protein MsbA